MNKKNLDQVEFKIVSILQRAFSISSFSLKKTIKIEDQIEGRLKFKINLDVKKNLIDFRLNLVYMQRDSDNKLGELETSILFHVKDLDSHVKDNSFSNDTIPVLLASISFSTFRGIVYETFRGTPFNDMPPLPIIDPKKIFN